jgi:hypothetical protein
MHFVCSTKSDKDGRFAFSCVPPGAFVVVPSYSSGGVHFDVAPSIVQIAVVNSPKKFDVRLSSRLKGFMVYFLQFQKPFEVKGFSVVGKVLMDAKGKAAAGVDVIVNGQKAATTDQSGKYTLQQITTGKYTIGAKTADVEFGSIDVELSPNNAIVPDVVAKGCVPAD